MTNHGGDVWSKKIKYDFSANINPLGMPECVKEALKEHMTDYEHYPDVNCTELKKAISEYEGVNAENIVCGNGAADLIYKISGSLKPENALVLAPTFSEYEKALSENGCNVNHLLLNENDNFKLNENIIEKIEKNDIMFLCNPNNPTGSVTENDLIINIAKKCEEVNSVLVIDECFMPFVKNKESAPLLKNVIILKAFTKIYAMAGLRLGYILCGDCETAKKISDFGQCWNVSVPAQIAGVAALKDKEYIEKTVEFISKEREFLTEELKKSGFKLYPSDTNFILFKSEKKLEDKLSEEGIAIRNCGNFYGLDNTFYRIAVRTHAENEELIKVLRK